MNEMCEFPSRYQASWCNAPARYGVGTRLSSRSLTNVTFACRRHALLALLITREVNTIIIEWPTVPRSPRPRLLENEL